MISDHQVDLLLTASHGLNVVNVNCVSILGSVPLESRGHLVGPRTCFCDDPVTFYQISKYHKYQSMIKY